MYLKWLLDEMSILFYTKLNIDCIYYYDCLQNFALAIKPLPISYMYLHMLYLVWPNMYDCMYIVKIISINVDLKIDVGKWLKKKNDTFDK